MIFIFNTKDLKEQIDLKNNFKLVKKDKKDINFIDNGNVFDIVVDFVVDHKDNDEDVQGLVLAINEVDLQHEDYEGVKDEDFVVVFLVIMTDLIEIGENFIIEHWS